MSLRSPSAMTGSSQEKLWFSSHTYVFCREAQMTVSDLSLQACSCAQTGLCSGCFCSPTAKSSLAPLQSCSRANALGLRL